MFEVDRMTRCVGTPRRFPKASMRVQPFVTRSGDGSVGTRICAWRQRRAVASVVAALVAAVIGAAGGAGIVAYVGVNSNYCPFETGAGMELPTPGYTGNVSPNATTYEDGSVVFTASASGCVPPYSFEWSFGDGTYSSAPNVVHVYSEPGYFAGSITIRDSAGHQAISYFCINATDWPTLTGGQSSSPGCSWLPNS
jgi:PKD domain